MRFDPGLQPGRLLRRYKRFLADIERPDGSTLTAHCPNTGAMLGCSDPGSPVWYSVSDNPKRKYPHTLELVESAGYLVGVHPGRANGLVAEALAAERVAPLAGWTFKAEQTGPDGVGRFDFGLWRSEPAKGEPAHGYLEVKSVTLVEQRVAAFPDAVSERALRHVRGLAAWARSGGKAVLLFCVQHAAARRMRCAAEIHPEYADAVADAAAVGVEVLAYKVRITPAALVLRDALPVDL